MRSFLKSIYLRFTFKSQFQHYYIIIKDVHILLVFFIRYYYMSDTFQQFFCNLPE